MIEIMVGLLGCMIAVLAMVAGALAVFGYTEIKKAAENAAEASAREIATKIGNDFRTQVLGMAQAGSLSEVQVSGAGQTEAPTAEETAEDAAAEPVTADNALSGKEEP